MSNCVYYLCSANTTKKGELIVDNKITSLKKQNTNSSIEVKFDSKNVTYSDDRSRTTLDGNSNNPFYSPPGEGPEPRITSN